MNISAGFGGDQWQPWLNNHRGERVSEFVDYASMWMYVWFDREHGEREIGLSGKSFQLTQDK